jgi:pretoxin HINT domain-containing protein
VKKAAKAVGRAAVVAAKAAYKYSGAQDVVSCVTDPTVAGCVKAAITVALVVGTAGEGEVAEIGLNAAEHVGEDVAEDAGSNVLKDAAASCGGKSFTADTKVLLASGKAVPISSLKPGEMVLATNTRTGKTRAETLSAVMVHHDTNLYNLTIRAFGQNAVIHTTSSHLFWVPDLDHWVTANKLTKGERLKTANGTVAAVVVGSTPKQHDGWMWDLTVQDDHDFYVLPATGPLVSTIGSDAVPVLVHNCGDLPARVWEHGRPETDNEPQGALPSDAPMVEPGETLAKGHYDYVVMQDGTLRAMNSDEMYALEPSAGHTSLAEGESVLMAGGFKADESGAITDFDNLSGHYMPSNTPGYMPLEQIARQALARHGLPSPGPDAWDYFTY